MQTTYKFICASMLVLLCPTTLATGQTFSCPESIIEQAHVDQSSVDAVAQGWQVSVLKGSRYLESASIYLEHQGEYGAQVPDHTTTKASKEVLTWNISQAPDFTFFVGCSYTNTSAVLYEKIDSRFKKCVLTYELLPTGSRQKVGSIKCK